MDEELDKEPLNFAPTKSELIRDTMIFQFKLFVDGARDFVLIPVSLIAAMISLLKPGSVAGSEFYDVVAFGRTTEKKINLFSVADKIEAKPAAEELPDLDTLVGEFESFVKKEYEGDRLAAARDRLRKLRETARKGDAAEDETKTDETRTKGG